MMFSTLAKHQTSRHFSLSAKLLTSVATVLLVAACAGEDEALSNRRVPINNPDTSKRVEQAMFDKGIGEDGPQDMGMKEGMEVTQVGESRDGLVVPMGSGGPQMVDDMPQATMAPQAVPMQQEEKGFFGRMFGGMFGGDDSSSTRRAPSDNSQLAEMTGQSGGSNNYPMLSDVPPDSFPGSDAVKQQEMMDSLEMARQQTEAERLATTGPGMEGASSNQNMLMASSDVNTGALTPSDMAPPPPMQLPPEQPVVQPQPMPPVGNEQMALEAYPAPVLDTPPPPAQQPAPLATLPPVQQLPYEEPPIQLREPGRAQVNPGIAMEPVPMAPMVGEPPAIEALPEQASGYDNAGQVVDEYLMLTPPKETNRAMRMLPESRYATRRAMTRGEPMPY